MAKNLARTLKLNSGFEMPIVGLGTLVYENKEQLADVIVDAYDAGYRHFDTAIAYENDEFIAKALQKLFARGVKREELFITTKVWPFKGKNMKTELEESLKRLQLSYVDLYLIHIPVTPIAEQDGALILTGKPVHETWQEFEELSKLGLAKSIGISNFNSQMVLDLLSYCKIKPAVNQFEVHPYLGNKSLIHTCKRFGIQVEAYSSIISGSVSLGGMKIDLNKPKEDIIASQIMKDLCKKYNKTAAQILLCYATSQEIVVIPKSVTKSRLIENLDCNSWKLSEEDIKKLDTFNQGLRKFDSLSQNFLNKGIDLWS